MKPPIKNLSLLSEHRLSAYTVAATAAGVGALCLAPAAEGENRLHPCEGKDCAERWSGSF